MPQGVQADCAAGLIWTEADFQFSVVKHLRESLSKAGTGRWFVASNHALFGVRPDVVCYLIEGDFGKFILKPTSYIVGAIEIKIAHTPVPDLPKLAAFQRRAGGIAWIIYGDHFSEKIHKSNYAAQLRRERAIRQWKGSRADRGYFILKTARLEKNPAFAATRTIIQEFNSKYWRHDH